MRFMIHPLKAASSFECDGCGHHASFHKMDNQKEEEIAKRWKVEESGKAQSNPQRLWEGGFDMIDISKDDDDEIEWLSKRRRIASNASNAAPAENNTVVATRKRIRVRKA